MIERSEQDGIVALRIAHGKAGALDLELVEGLARAVAEVSASDARAVILTGSGSIFSAGVDLFRLTEGGRAYAERFVPALARMMLDLFALPKPLVVAANGHAIAGGCIMTLAADYRLMVEGNARIGIPELLAGVPFPPTIIEALRFALPPQHVQMLMYTGKNFMSDEALRLGIVDEVASADALPSRAMEIAQQFGALPPRAFQMAKRQLRDPILSRAKHYAAELEGEVLDLWSEPSTHARIRQHLDKTVKK